MERELSYGESAGSSSPPKVTASNLLGLCVLHVCLCLKPTEAPIALLGASTLHCGGEVPSGSWFFLSAVETLCAGGGWQQQAPYGCRGGGLFGRREILEKFCRLDGSLQPRRGSSCLALAYSCLSGHSFSKETPCGQEDSLSSHGDSVRGERALPGGRISPDESK